jgi:hypothetical protein
MRKLLAATMLLLVCGCQPSVKVPTAQELVGNPQLLADWQARCNTGEYSHLAGAEYSKMCSSTQDASMTVTQMQAGKKDSDFFGNMSKRK